MKKNQIIKSTHFTYFACYSPTQLPSSESNSRNHRCRSLSPIFKASAFLLFDSRTLLLLSSPAGWYPNQTVTAPVVRTPQALIFIIEIVLKPALTANPMVKLVCIAGSIFAAAAQFPQVEARRLLDGGLRSRLSDDHRER